MVSQNLHTEANIDHHIVSTYKEKIEGQKEPMTTDE